MPLIPVILQQFENDIQNVYSQMDNWIEFAPNQWNIDKAEWKLHCNLLWLTPEWHKKTIKTFKEIIEICFNMNSNTFYSIIYLIPSVGSNERLNLALLLSDGKRVLFDFSTERVQIVSKLVGQASKDSI